VEFFDISQTLIEGIVIWPGDPEFMLQPASRIADGEPANVSALRIGTHTGTHLDAPSHVDESGKDVTGFQLKSLIGPVRVIRFFGETCIRAADLAPQNWEGVARVLFYTRRGDGSKGSFDPGFIYLHEDVAEFLAGKGILLVGTDAPSVDSYGSLDLPVHKILLRSGTVILENALLDGILPGDYNLVCLPLKLAGADGSPARAILWR
jgi:arylformamidase